MDNCTIDCIQLIGNYSQAQTCSFATTYCVQETAQFVKTFYCYLDQSSILLIIMSIFTLLLVYYAINDLSNDYLTPCVEQFIQKLNMSHGLAGVTFLAFAVGAPDIITAVVAGSSTSASTALIPFGSLYGAALFDMAFVLSMVIKFTPTQELIIQKRDALIPLTFFILGTIYLFCVSLFYGKMNILLAILFFSLYLVFIGIALHQEHKKRKLKKKNKLQAPLTAQNQNQRQSSDNQQKEDQEDQEVQVPSSEPLSEQPSQIEKDKEKLNFISKVVFVIQRMYKFVFDYTVPPANKNQWGPLRTIISLIIAPIITCISFGCTCIIYLVNKSFESTLLSIPYAAWFSLPPFLFLIHTIYCIVKGQRPQRSSVLYSIYSFIIIVCLITEACSILINLMELLQLLTNINSVFLGLTVFAWAGSIGDYLSIVAFAKKGYTSTAVSGIFSGPLMNFLLGFGITCILNSLSGEYDFIIFNFIGETYQKISDSIVVSVIGITTFYMFWIFFQIVRKNGILRGFEQKYALIYYITFLAIAVGLSIMTDFYRVVQCDL